MKIKRQYDDMGQTFYQYKGFTVRKGNYRKRANGYSDWNGVSFPKCWKAIKDDGAGYSFIGNTLKECLREIDAREERRASNR